MSGAAKNVLYSLDFDNSLLPCPLMQNAHNGTARTTLSTLLHRVPCFHPALFALRIMPNVRVAHGRQFTGGVFAGVSMRVRTVGDDLSIFVGQQLWREFLDPFRRNVQGSGKMSLAIAFGRERLDYCDSLLFVELGF